MRKSTINAAKYGRIKRQAEESITITGGKIMPIWHKGIEVTATQVKEVPKDLLRPFSTFVGAMMGREEDRGNML